MKKLIVNLRERSYPIVFENGQPEECGRLLKKQFPKSKFFVITDSNVKHVYERKIEFIFPPHTLITIPSGENHKTLETAMNVFTQLIENGANRSSVIIAFGGGVVGDLAGFVAATYMRGLPYVQIPTTLLAMTDSAVGGKVAVNHHLGKNTIGAFYQPKFVFIDTDFLKTLPHRELVSGLAEVIKYGLAIDKHFLAWFEKNRTNILLLNPAALEHTVIQSCTIKAKIVSRDERESRRRMVLNFGHTWAHAFETLTRYRLFSHGEAVLFGMLAAGHLSYLLKKISHEEFLHIRKLISVLLPDFLKRRTIMRFFRSVGWNEMRAAIQSDKKTQEDRVRWILLDHIGKAVIAEEVSDAVAEKSFEYLKQIGTHEPNH
jgi:3-dehydroquinate synthase